MPSLLKKLFASAQLGTAYATYYTAPAATNTYIRAGMLQLVNNTAAIVTGVYVHAVPSAGAAGDTNALVHNFSVPAGDSVPFPVADIVLAPGDFISAKASATLSIVIHGSGIEVT